MRSFSMYLNASRKPLMIVPFLLVACAQPRMVPPQEVAGGTVLDAKNRSSASGAFVNEAFDLGAYKVAKVKRKLESSSSFSISNYNQNKTTTGYSYQLEGGITAWKGVCAMSRSEKGASIGSLSFSKTKSNLTCECTGGAQPGRLELKAADNGTYAGTFTPAGKSYEMTPVTETDKKTFGGGPAGYRFDGSDGARGAVETLKPGRIWFTEKLAPEEREPAACVLTGLMLYVEPSEND